MMVSVIPSSSSLIAIVSLVVIIMGTVCVSVSNALKPAPLLPAHLSYHSEHIVGVPVPITSKSPEVRAVDLDAEALRARIKMMAMSAHNYEQSVQQVPAQAHTNLRGFTSTSSSSVSFVNAYMYGSYSCTGSTLELQSSWGVNVCLLTTSAQISGGATILSTQYLWNSSTSTLYQGFYSNTACSTANLVDLGVVEVFSALYEHVCSHGVLYSVTTEFAVAATGSYPVQGVGAR
jgi:hypothetical protein